ncbi:SGNH/GDSL hydrolase family protein [Rothia aerolata]|uniref:SGNH hydrolase n=1 Tax=Rothia aerolata TaxID=1812262 RepID=A0A917MSW4_9MICC|nr:SGNH/GDSL hydrolase family protein [Rothia aerolata]GGH62322.1 SGNH hydrolase [Rothia aerolata]
MSSILSNDHSIRYVAIGDSFTEGVGDPDPERPNGVRGWADRVAEQFMLADSEALYANLAIRGRLLGQIIDEQLQAAIDLKPNLVSFYGGGNDILRPNTDIDQLMSQMEEGFKALRAADIEVFTFTGMDVRDFNAFKATRPKTAIYNELLREIADEHGVKIVDFWRMRDFVDQRYFAPDRLHLNTRGHIKMAGRVLDLLSDESISMAGPQTLPIALPKTRMQRLRDEARWTREFVVPWVGRRLRGTSSGDGLSPKYPELTRFEGQQEKASEQ